VFLRNLHETIIADTAMWIDMNVVDICDTSIFLMSVHRLMTTPVALKDAIKFSFFEELSK